MRFARVFWRLVLVLALALPVLFGPVAPRTEEAEAQGLGGVLMVGRIFGGLRARNRLYRDANAYIAEKQEYYDRLRETAREQLREREVGGLRRSQLAAYIKVVALIEAERQGMIDFAEGEKRAARQQFLDTVENTIVDRILASGAAQRALGAIKDGIDSVDEVIEKGLEQIAGGGGGALEEVAQVREIATRAGQAAALVGGDKGARIAGAMHRVVEVTRAPTAEIEDGLRQAQQEIAPVRDEVEDLQERGKAPTASQVAEPVVMNALPGGGDDAALETIVGVLAAKADREGGSFRDRARAALTGQFLARCAEIGARYREAVSRLEGAAAGEEMSDQEAAAPCNALDLEELAAQADPAETQPSAAGENSVQGEGDGPITALTASAVDGFCHDTIVKLQGGGQYQVCNYQVSWELTYQGIEPPARATCFAAGIGRRNQNVGGFLGFKPWTRIVEPSGTWMETFEESGQYPEPAIYQDQFICEIHAGADGEGGLLVRAQVDLVVDMSEVRTD